MLRLFQTWPAGTPTWLWYSFEIYHHFLSPSWLWALTDISSAFPTAALSSAFCQAEWPVEATVWTPVVLTDIGVSLLPPPVDRWGPTCIFIYTCAHEFISQNTSRHRKLSTHLQFLPNHTRFGLVSSLYALTAFWDSEEPALCHPYRGCHPDGHCPMAALLVLLPAASHRGNFLAWASSHLWTPSSPSEPLKFLSGTHGFFCCSIEYLPLGHHCRTPLFRKVVERQEARTQCLNIK
jgi:hypothetical protein